MAPKNKTHGLSLSPVYRVWQTMRLRCGNPTNAAYADYGGRGINVCEGWANNIASFVADMGPKPTPKHEIDRIDNDKGYTCGHCADCQAHGWVANCRWATRKENDRNRRSNRMMTYKGETLPAVAWCERLGLSYMAIMKRLEDGQSDEQALSVPVKPKAKNGQGKPKKIPGSPHAGRKFSDALIQQMLDERATGTTVVALSEKSGISASYLKKLFSGTRSRGAAKAA